MPTKSLRLKQQNVHMAGLAFIVLMLPNLAWAARGGSHASVFAFFHFLFIGVIGIFSFVIGFKLFPNAKASVQISLGFLIGGLLITFFSELVRFLTK
jgi:hypothetical protein